LPLVLYAAIRFSNELSQHQNLNQLKVVHYHKQKTDHNNYTGSLSQTDHNVTGSLSEVDHKHTGLLSQTDHNVTASLSEGDHNLTGSLSQTDQNNTGSLYEGDHNHTSSLSQSDHNDNDPGSLSEVDHKHFDFFSSLAFQARPMWNVVSASEGRYNRCGDEKPMTWLLLSGHIRSMHSHLPNLISFLEGSSDCWFVVVFTRNDLTGDQMGYSLKCEEGSDCAKLSREYNVTDHLIDIQKTIGSNFAYCVNERNFEKDWIGNAFSPEWPGATMTSQLVAQAHGIRHNSADIAILSRPDIMVSNSIQTKNLHELASKRNATFLLPHISWKFGTGNDPSEVWVLMTWDLLIGMCDMKVSLAPCKTNKNSSQCLSPMCLADFTTSDSQCGHYYKRVLSAGTSHMNASTYYIRPEFKVHFHRINGDWGKHFPDNNRQTAPIHPENNVSAPLDLMKNVGCEFSPSNVCDKGASSPTILVGNYTATYRSINYGGAAYVCTQRFDIQN